MDEAHLLPCCHPSTHLSSQRNEYTCHLNAKLLPAWH